MTDASNASADGDPGVSPATPEETQTAALARSLAARVAEGRPPRQPAAARWPLARRPAALTDEEIDAQAAAIIAQARAEEDASAASPQAAAEVPAARDPATPDTAEPLAPLDFLPPLRERDQLWLIAGLVCCAILIVIAVVFVRAFAG